VSVEFTVLASGSGGNASLIQAGAFGLLLDLGLGPRKLSHRLATFGSSLDHVHAALLTHTHADHWRERTLVHLARGAVPVYCHPNHRKELSLTSPGFRRLEKEHLVRTYEDREEFLICDKIRCRPVVLQHDGRPTFGFRFDVQNGSSPFSLAYAADLGCWDSKLADFFANVDLLALEFNHDEKLEHGSGRPAPLIRRVLGDEGHLSNLQAAALLRDVVRRSSPGKLQHLVQLHLSRDCNRPDLAIRAAREALYGSIHPITIHTACQHQPIRPCLTPRERTYIQRMLPGMEI
jgi:phosphoribosyl 1,2-cyclic phosphodiesterase